MDKRSGLVGFVSRVWWVRKGDRWLVGGSMDSGCHKLSENIWFVWSGRSYSGEKVGCHACPRTDGRRNVKIGLEFRKQNIIRWGVHVSG